LRTIALGLSVILSFMIPWEGVIRIAGLGTGSKVMGYGLAAFWLATVVITGRLRKPRPFHIMLYLFVLWNAVSVFWSMHPGETAAHVATWVQLFLFALIWWDLYTTRTAVLAGLQAYVLGAYVAIGGAIVNYFIGYQFYTHYDRYSPGETNPDGFGFIMALGIPVAWYLTVSTSAMPMDRLLKLVNYTYIPAALVGIALSGTRTALIASVPAMAFGLISLTYLRLWARVAILLLLIVAILILLPHIQSLTSFQRFSTIGSELTKGDLNERTLIWRDGFAAFAEHPLIGVGSDMYPSINSLGKAAHNSFLSVLVEVGLIGFALFALILTIAVIQAWNQSRWDSKFWLTILLIWAIGASTLTWGHRKPTWLFLNLIIASAAIAHHRDETVPFVQPNEPETPPLPYSQGSELPLGAKENSYLV
jgi:O-antigen ligase